MRHIILACFILTLIVAALAFAYPASAALDRESMDCLGCHDATIASDVTLQVCPEPNCDHPLGVNYRLLSMTNRGLVPVKSLHPSIKLAGNNFLGCGSCHVPFDQTNHSILSSMRNLYPDIPDPMLVMDNRKSELCLACHRK